MADEIDNANDVAQMHLDHALQQRKQAPGLHLEPVGECHNCGDGVGPKQIFCDAECSNDHSYMMHRMKMNRRVV